MLNLETIKQLSPADPRWIQILILSSLLCFGLLTDKFHIPSLNILCFFCAVLITQTLWDKLHLKRHINWKSALITGLSLSILLRVGSFELALLAGVLAISSKFIFIYQQQHFINPAAFAIVSMSLLFSDAWTSAGQWGHSIIFLLVFSILGLWVTQQAKSLSTAVLFIIIYAGLLLTRALWLGDPLSIWLNQLNNGAFIIFSFFMITDPKTTPRSWPMRILFCSFVALIAYMLQFEYYLYQALFPALVISSLLFLMLKRFDTTTLLFQEKRNETLT